MELLAELLEQIVQAGRARGLDQRDIVARAGLGETTLSKAKRADDIRLSTLARMANVVGLRLALVANDPHLEALRSRDLFGAGAPDGPQEGD